MKFDEAMKQLEELAGDRACKLEYSLMKYRFGDYKPEIECYIAGYNWCSGSKTFEGCLAKMKDIMTVGLPDEPQIKEAENDT
uniref:Uncharacterized protein n=1 Tax=viral metagenome TaxID=1070528 RepID=A0A6M3LP01_9ZZZZ